MKTQLLVCDLDNTLYDWVGYFVPAFYAMVDDVVRSTGCDREMLLDDFRSVHQRHHDSEHPFALLETPTVERLFPGFSLAEKASALDSAFHAFNRVRKDNLALYPSVREALEAITDAGITIVAHTESKLYAVVDRLTRLGLAPYFKKIYCRERSRSSHPDVDYAEGLLARFPVAKIIELAHHQRKPNPTVLLEICEREGISPSRTAYIGDSIARDILMARDAGVKAIWAKYGTRHDPSLYAQLVRITHWTSDDVAREAELRTRAAGVKPDYSLENEFGEVIELLPAARRRTTLRSALSGSALSRRRTA